MRKLSICMLLLFATLTLFSQQTSSPDTLTKQDYLQKSKSQKTAAWIFFGLGTTLIFVAATGEVSFDALPIIAIGATTSLISSTVLFFAAGRNKRKAMQLSAHIELQQHQIKIYTGSTTHYFPVISIKATL